VLLRAFSECQRMQGFPLPFAVLWILGLVISPPLLGLMPAVVAKNLPHVADALPFAG